MKTRLTIIASALSIVLVSGCSDSGTIITGQNFERRLKQIDNSDEFFAELREGLKQQSSYYGGGVAIDLQAPDAVAAPTAPSANTDGSAQNSSAESAGSSGSAGDSAPLREVTQTNVQEVGVDEQDRMKSDGEFLYILENRYADVYPVELGIGDGAEPLLVAPGDVAATSIAVPPKTNTVVRVLSMQPDTPDATAVRDISVDLGGRQAQGMYLYKKDGKRNLVLASSGFNYYWASWNRSIDFAGRESLVTKLDVSDPNNPSVNDSFQIDGQIISSRRIGNKLFVASRFYPQIKGIDPYSMTEQQYRDAIDAADLTQALPKYTRVEDGSSEQLVDPRGCFVATKPSQDSYYSPDIVSLSVINIDTMELTDSECYLGSSETLYATPNAVYLATTRWDYASSPAIDFDDVMSGSTFVDPRVDTDVHQFVISDSGLNYSGSGVVSGHLGWNPLRKPFRMSEQNGYLRVATFSGTQSRDVSPINLTVLNVDGSGELYKVAQLPNQQRPDHIGKPGEQLYASRFLGDRAYLVTFRQTDPLYVVDLSKPEDPFLAGELEIDGYSDYLQPIGRDYLLGIGKDARPAPDGWGDGFGALAQGVKLSLFNVSDPQNPSEVQSMVIGERGTEADALQNHRAITIQPATDAHPTRVAFGISVAGSTVPDTTAAADRWYPWSFTGLHGFEIKTGADAGIIQSGVMKVESASNGLRFGPTSHDDRSVIVNDSVYYIHGSRVYVAPWGDMSSMNGPR